ncbi:MAG: hypothetical protein J6L83_05830, partial [Clostridia bacterium]|nr:hypothetical protein [Clostridia bacterium]
RGDNPSVAYGDSSLYTRELCWWMFVRFVAVKSFTDKVKLTTASFSTFEVKLPCVKGAVERMRD